MKLRYAELDSPLGRMCFFVSPDGLCILNYVEWMEGIHKELERRFGSYERVPEADPDGVVSRLERYLAGELAAIDDIRVDMGGSEFQQRVWAGLRRIPAGRVWSYGEQAREIGAPVGASRAVGLANGSNPVSIVVPCHRVIGANGMLTGYGGGLERKRWLLRHEGLLVDGDRVRDPAEAEKEPDTARRSRRAGRETPSQDDGQLSLWQRS